MNSPPQRLDDLFVRHWDNTLTDAEAAELAAILASDPHAREQFQLLCLQAVAAAELPPVCLPALEAKPRLESDPATAPAPAPPKARVSRRRALGLVGGGVAAGLGIALGRWVWQEWSTDPVKLVTASGAVRVRGANGNALPTLGALPTGASVSTQGPGSHAILRFADGSTIWVLGDSAVTIHDDGRQVRLHQGTASADVRSQSDARSRITLATHLVSLPALSGAMVTLGQSSLAADLEVHSGTVAAAHPTGEPMAVVGAGELLTVRRAGGHRKCPTPRTPKDYQWNLDEPLPDGWQVGQRKKTPEGHVVVPDSWPDPYYNGTRMYQIRSDHQWTRGFFRIVPESTIHVRYRVRESGPGQVCFCVRNDHLPSSATGMFEHNANFTAGPAGQWQEWTVRAREMLDNKHAPTFSAPWVGFLVIFNTYEADLGLEVAEFKVASPAFPDEEELE